MTSRSQKTCAHKDMYVNGPPYAAKVGFDRLPLDKRLAAATRSGRPPSKRRRDDDADDEVTPSVIKPVVASTFPSPLVLPGDCLALDPAYPPQSLRSWLTLKGSLKDVPGRRTLYVVPPPVVSKEAKKLMTGWEKPNVPKGFSTPRLPKNLEHPKVSDTCDYLSAFYHPMEADMYEGECQWSLWEEENPSADSNRIALQITGPNGTVEQIGIRYRPSPDGIAREQLNLNDILDGVQSMFPADAYAVIMMLDYDLYEDEDDDFCCGRAYGGDHIAVVSSFRYHPALDTYEGLDYDHMWPVSHCKTYVDELCAEAGFPPPKRRPNIARKVHSSLDVSASPGSPLGNAIHAAKNTPRPKSKHDFEALWFSRVARTAAHEMGHCFFLDHCVYYACAMQGTAGMAEDVRQPPYLCPVCLAKISLTLIPSLVRDDDVEVRSKWMRERYGKLAALCGRWGNVSMFTGFGAWLGRQLELEKEENCAEHGEKGNDVGLISGADGDVFSGPAPRIPSHLRSP